MSTDAANAHVIPPITLGWRLQMALAHSEYSVQGIADALGVSRNTVARWMHDGGKVHPLFVKEWATLTGVDYEWLAGLADTDQYPWPLGLSGTLPALYLSGEDFARTLGP
jgi:transcriptional regulator with XRE-family HTH domain